MKPLAKYVVFVMLVLISTAIDAALTNRMFDVRHIGYAEGLSSQRVFSIVEDGHGAIWIATKTGIDRYNGQAVKNYELEGSSYYGDFAGRKLHLIDDVRQGLWAYDNTGRVYHYSVTHDRFVQTLHIGQAIGEDVVLNKLAFDADGVLWIGLDKGLFRWENDGSVIAVLRGEYVNDIVFAGERLLAGTFTGVWQVSCKGAFEKSQLLSGRQVQTLFWDGQQEELWIGLFDSGLLLMSSDGSEVTSLGEQDTKFLHPIRAITSYDPATVLIGVDGGGVYAVDRDTKKVHLLMNAEDTTEFFLRGNGVYAVTPDRQGNIWIGSYTGGVSVAIRQKHPVSILVHEKGNAHSLPSNNVNDIEENSDGRQWFATDAGISIRQVATGIWRHVLKETVTVSLCKAGNGEVWAGTYGDGVYLLDAEGRVLRHLTRQQGGLATNYIFSIRQDEDGDLWIGGLDGCLMMIGKGGEERQTFDVKWVQSIEVVDRERIAVATVNGFCIVNKSKGDIQYYATSQESHNRNFSAYIISMLFNDDGTVWLGTEGGGVILYDMQTREVKSITMREGLPSNDVYSLQLDDRCRLWVSTGKGIALIDGGDVLNLSYVGNIDKEYNKSSFVKLSDGGFAYGSTDGVVFIMPLTVSVADYDGTLRFTGITVDYQDSGEEERMKPLIHEMLADGLVCLDYKHNSFDVSFESINYRFQRDIVYRYLLEGYDKGWSDSSADGQARYTKVAPGTYLFRVCSLRRSDGKILAESTLKVKVGQPWWNSWWAWTLYVCLVGIVFYFILRYKSNRLQKKYDEDKIRFFIDTAHDIRTPVALIMAPLEDLRSEQGLSDKVRYLLNLAHESTCKLHSLISQLLEFEKVDAPRRQLQLVPVNLAEVLSKELASFRALCDKKQLALRLSVPETGVYVPAERHLVEMLFDNLLSNACKYTMPQGTVSVSLRLARRKVVITLKDSGIGIPKQARKHIFSDIYRAENARRSQEEGTGFGLLQVHRIVKMLRGKIVFQSEEGKGTTFVVTLPRVEASAECQPMETAIPVTAPVGPTDGCLPDRDRKEDRQTLTDGQEADSDSRNTLLIVEDHEALRSYLRQTFESSYRVVDVADGQEAMAYLEHGYPDLILSDVMMPGIQGDELCRLVKENPATSGIPVILLTAKTNHEAMAEGLKKGADDYIAKPFSTEILRLKVQGAIDNRNRLREFLLRQAIAQVGTGGVAERQADAEGMAEEKRVADEGQSDGTPADSWSESDRQFVVQATRIVMEHLDELDFNINLLCREMAMSRTLFYSRLKSLTGKGPQEFIRIIRLQKAAELLKEGKSVAEVAEETGFVNTKYFSSLFKKQFGMQPSKYSEKADGLK